MWKTPEVYLRCPDCLGEHGGGVSFSNCWPWGGVSPVLLHLLFVLCIKVPHVLVLALVCGHEAKTQRVAVVSCPSPTPHR